MTGPWQPILRDANSRLSRDLRRAGESIWSADVSDRDLQVGVKFIGADPNLPLYIYNDLETDRVLLRDRIYVVDQRRVQWARSYLRLEQVAGTLITQRDTGAGGTPAQLAAVGLEPVTFVEDVTFATVPNGDEVRALENFDALAVVRIIRRDYAADDQLVQVTDMRLVADAYRFRWAFSV